MCTRLTRIYDNTGAALGRNWGASASFGYKWNHAEKSEIELCTCQLQLLEIRSDQFYHSMAILAVFRSLIWLGMTSLPPQSSVTGGLMLLTCVLEKLTLPTEYMETYIYLCIQRHFRVKKQRKTAKNTFLVMLETIFVIVLLCFACEG